MLLDVSVCGPAKHVGRRSLRDVACLMLNQRISKPLRPTEWRIDREEKRARCPAQPAGDGSCYRHTPRADRCIPQEHALAIEFRERKTNLGIFSGAIDSDNGRGHFAVPRAR